MGILSVLPEKFSRLLKRDSLVSSLAVELQIQGDTKKRELLKNPTKIEEIQEKNLLTEIEQLKLAF